MNEQNKKRNYDYTSTQRAKRRQDHLHAVAQANGFDTWYKLETAVINGAVLTIQVNWSGEDDDRDIAEARSCNLA